MRWLPSMLLLALAGCAGAPQQSSWTARWPDAVELRGAAVAAARDPRTWAPLAGAALLSATGADDGVSDWIAERQPLFGSDAAGSSDALRDAALGAYLLSALAAPDETAADKLSQLGVGVVTLYGQGAIVEGLKEMTGRRRPDRSDRQSLPSGHTSTAAAASRLAMANLARFDMPSTTRKAAAFGLEAIALGTGWARIEAGKHHATDVLAGYAVGHFIASFAQAAFIDQRLPDARVRYQPLQGGGALRLTVPLAHRYTGASHARLHRDDSGGPYGQSRSSAHQARFGGADRFGKLRAARPLTGTGDGQGR